jgi:hypothetical protein
VIEVRREAGEDVTEGGFAGPISADDGAELALGDVQAEVI